MFTFRLVTHRLRENCRVPREHVCKLYAEDGSPQGELARRGSDAPVSNLPVRMDDLVSAVTPGDAMSFPTAFMDRVVLMWRAHLLAQANLHFTLRAPAAWQPAAFRLAAAAASEPAVYESRGYFRADTARVECARRAVAPGPTRICRMGGCASHK